MEQTISLVLVELPTKSFLWLPHAACSWSWARTAITGSYERTKSKAYLWPTRLMWPADPSQLFSDFSSFFPIICSLWSTCICLLTVLLANQTESCLRVFVFTVAYLECLFTDIHTILSLSRYWWHVIPQGALLSLHHSLFCCLLYLSSKYHSCPSKTHTHLCTHTHIFGINNKVSLT